MTNEKESEIVKRLLKRMKFHRDESNRLHGLSTEDWRTKEDQQKLSEDSHHHAHIFGILCMVWDEHGSDKGLNEILDGLKD